MHLKALVAPLRPRLILPGIMIGLSVFAQTGNREETLRFRKHILTPRFVSEGVAIADVDRDGRPDVLAGSHWYRAPEQPCTAGELAACWTPHEIRAPKSWPGGLEDLSDAFLHYADDLNGDGYPDFIRVDFPGKDVVWYENPRGVEGHWKEHVLAEAVGNEIPMFVDVDRDGRNDLVYATGGHFVWKRLPGASPSLPTGPFAIGEKDGPGAATFWHGNGYAAISGDVPALIVRNGIYTRTSDPEQPWTFEPADLFPDAGNIEAQDFDADGDVDLVASSAHTYGVWWAEQAPSADGKPGWTRRTIDTTISETHSLALVSGAWPVAITGKRLYPHADKDPGALETPFTVVYQPERVEGRVVWRRTIVDDVHGIGMQVLTRDVTGDGRWDIVTSNKRGVVVYEQLPAEN